MIFAPQWEYLATSGDIFDCHDWGYWHLVNRPERLLNNTQDNPSQQRNYLVQNDNSTKMRNPVVEPTNVNVLK